MINFLIYFTFIIILNSLRSSRNYFKFESVYKNLKFYKFKKHGSIYIANERSKDELIIISYWNYMISEKIKLNFDIWTLVDLHKLYWLVKFNNYFRKKNHYKDIIFI